MVVWGRRLDCNYGSKLVLKYHIDLPNVPIQHLGVLCKQRGECTHNCGKLSKGASERTNACLPTYATKQRTRYCEKVLITGDGVAIKRSIAA